MINGITFDSRNVRAKDDARVRQKMFSDGILSGCGITHSGKDLTIGVGSFIVAGRQIEISIAETITSSTTEANGYGRLRFVIDLTAEPSETVFTQYRWEWDYQSANSGWPVLTQEDINADGDTYEVAMATVSFSASNISGVVDRLPGAKTGGSVILSKTLTAAGWSSNQQTISDAAIYSASAPGDVRIAQSATDAQFEAWNAAQPRVVDQDTGSITIKITGDVPAVDIPVVVEVR